MTQMTWTQIAERSLWTAIESGLAILTAEAVLDVTMPLLATAGIATGLSFVKNLAVQRLQVLGRLQG